MRATLAVSLLLTAALPAAAQPHAAPASPWSVESPGSLGTRFGLGFDLLLDRLDDLEAAAGRQTVTVRGPDGGEETTVVPFDPRLDDRKHGRDWEERSAGLQVPIALPPLRFGRGLVVEPSLVLEAAAVEGRFTIADLVEGRPDRRLDGTGARWGVGVQALGGLCRGCRWFWGAGYRYSTLAGLDLGSDTRPDPAGLTVTETTEIDHDAHHLTVRLGALVAGGRATVYLGARDRRSDLVVSDETTLRSPQGPDFMTVATKLDLEGDDTAALAGADFRLGRGYVGRVEATFGGEGESVLLKVVRAPKRRPSQTPASGDEPETPDEVERRRERAAQVADSIAPAADGPESPDEIERRRERAAQLADSIAPAVDLLRRDFARRVREIEERAGPGRPLPTAPVLELLDDLEARLREALAAPELLPVLSWFVHYLDRARADVAAEGVITGWFAGSTPPRGLAFAAVPMRQDPPRPAAPPPTSARDWLARIRAALELLYTRSDTQQLTQDLCISSEPSLDAKVTLWPSALDEADENTRTHFKVRSTRRPMSALYRGRYAYRAEHADLGTFTCRKEDPETCEYVDLWTNEEPVLNCDFGHRLCQLEAGSVASCAP